MGRGGPATQPVCCTPCSIYQWLKDNGVTSSLTHTTVMQLNACTPGNLALCTDTRAAWLLHRSNTRVHPCLQTECRASTAHPHKTAQFGSTAQWSRGRRCRCCSCLKPYALASAAQQQQAVLLPLPPPAERLHEQQQQQRMSQLRTTSRKPCLSQVVD